MVAQSIQLSPHTQIPPRQTSTHRLRMQVILRLMYRLENHGLRDAHLATEHQLKSTGQGAPFGEHQSSRSRASSGNCTGGISRLPGHLDAVLEPSEGEGRDVIECGF